MSMSAATPSPIEYREEEKETRRFLLIRNPGGQEMGDQEKEAGMGEVQADRSALREKLVHGDLTDSIIGAAIHVHRTLGPGFLEAIYQGALEVELRHRQIPFECQCAVPILYRGVDVGSHRLDLLVAHEVVVELKAIKSLEDIHFATVRSYLAATKKTTGLLINFAHTKLVVKRVLGA
jgi:GxxExxY protein